MWVPEGDRSRRKSSRIEAKKISLTALQKTHGSMLKKFFSLVADHHVKLWSNFNAPYLSSSNQSENRSQTVLAKISSGDDVFQGKNSSNRGLHAEMSAASVLHSKSLIPKSGMDDRPDDPFDGAKISSSSPCCARCSVALSMLGVKAEKETYKDISMTQLGRWIIPKFIKDSYLEEFLGDNANKIFNSVNEVAQYNILMWLEGAGEMGYKNMYADAFDAAFIDLVKAQEHDSSVGKTFKS